MRGGWRRAHRGRRRRPVDVDDDQLGEERDDDGDDREDEEEDDGRLLVGERAALGEARRGGRRARRGADALRREAGARTERARQLARRVGGLADGAHTHVTLAVLRQAREAERRRLAPVHLQTHSETHLQNTRNIHETSSNTPETHSDTQKQYR